MSETRREFAKKMAAASKKSRRVLMYAMVLRYSPEASCITFTRSLEYGLLTLETLVRYTLHRTKLFQSALYMYFSGVK